MVLDGFVARPVSVKSNANNAMLCHPPSLTYTAHDYIDCPDLLVSIYGIFSLCLNYRHIYRQQCIMLSVAIILVSIITSTFYFFRIRK
jgi:hypothetical protein